MNYEATCKILAKLVSELRKSGESIPPNVMEDLLSAKTTIGVLKLNSSRCETNLRTEKYLRNVESYLIPMAETKFGQNYIEEIMVKIQEAQKNVQEEQMKSLSKFHIRLPRDKHWIRIKDSKETPLKKVRLLSEEMGLQYKIQEDGYLLVHANDKKIRKFIKRLANTHSIEHNLN